MNRKPRSIYRNDLSPFVLLLSTKLGNRVGGVCTREISDGEIGRFRQLSHMQPIVLNSILLRTKSQDFNYLFTKLKNNSFVIEFPHKSHFNPFTKKYGRKKHDSREKKIIHSLAPYKEMKKTRRSLSSVHRSRDWREKYLPQVVESTGNWFQLINKTWSIYSKHVWIYLDAFFSSSSSLSRVGNKDV
jgi:hypothetical protein